MHPLLLLVSACWVSEKCTHGLQGRDWVNCAPGECAGVDAAHEVKVAQKKMLGDEKREGDFPTTTLAPPTKMTRSYSPILGGVKKKKRWARCRIILAPLIGKAGKASDIAPRCGVEELPITT